MNTTTTPAALSNFIALAQGMINAARGSVAPVTLTVEPGRKYAKVVESTTFNGHTSRSVYCFVEMSTGNVLKPASWRGPAPIARGNIHGENPLAGCGPYGIAYLA